MISGATESAPVLANPAASRWRVTLRVFPNGEPCHVRAVTVDGGTEAEALRAAFAAIRSHRYLVVKVLEILRA